MHDLDGLLTVGSLVVYKKRPARVASVGERLVIELPDGGEARVRPKDVLPLHPGPLNNLQDLNPPPGEVTAAWELVWEGKGQGRPLNLEELAELVFGAYTPATAWGAWGLLEEGLYFVRAATGVIARSPEEVARLQNQRRAREAEAEAWAAFSQRAQAGQVDLTADAVYLQEIEALARGETRESPVLRMLGRRETPEAAHALLLEIGAWGPETNPHPPRLGVALTLPPISARPLPDEPRRDLTHLQAFAIDDPHTRDPDDAISLDGDRLWVHIADVAARVPPGCQADQEARARGATLYLPDNVVPMLPEGAVAGLGMGERDPSPALSLGLQLNKEGEIVDLAIMPTWVRVTRLTYAQVDALLDEEPFRHLAHWADLYRHRRLANGAVLLNLPEVNLRVINGQVEILPLAASRSRDLVQEAMLMAGEAAARFANQNALAFPFVLQDPPAIDREKKAPHEDLVDRGLAGDYAVLRTLTRSQVATSPAPHAGVGLPLYSRVTSPLRRYMDLVAHQQLRAFLAGDSGLDSRQLVEIIGAADATNRSLQRAELLSRRHWTLVYLLQNPGWKGQGVLVEKRRRRGTILVPDLAYETRLHLPKDLPLNTRLTLRVKEVDLPALEAYFEILAVGE